MLTEKIIGIIGFVFIIIFMLSILYWVFEKIVEGVNATKDGINAIKKYLNNDTKEVTDFGLSIIDKLKQRKEANKQHYFFEQLIKESKLAEEELIMFMFQKNNYLHSSLWDNKRKQVLKRDKYTCQSCGMDNVELHVHHMSGYSKIPEESTGNLVTLCKDCHEYQHKIYGYPKTYKDYMEWNAPLVKKGM